LFVHVMGFLNVNISLESVDWLLSFTSEIICWSHLLSFIQQVLGCHLSKMLDNWDIMQLN
jgi:hypothetical protein